MGGILSRFRGADESDYERILSDLDDKIQRVEIRLSEIRIRERRALVMWLLYSIIAYVLYLVGFLMYLNNPYDEWFEWTIKVAPAVVGPILIMLIRSLLNLWYRRKQTNEESELINLRANQKLKVEELKKKTAYYSTKSLLERYDSPGSRSASAPPPRDRQGVLQTNGGPQQPPNPVPNGQQQVPPVMRPSQQRPGPGAGLPPLPAGSVPQTRPGVPPQPNGTGPSSPAQRHWYDKIADLIVGDEGPETRYALVCEKCFAHNGLALAEEVEDVQYVCPKCGHFNPSRRRRKQGGPLGLPASAAQHYQRPSSNPLLANGNSSANLSNSAASQHEGRGRSVTPRSIEGAGAEDGLPPRASTVQTRSWSAARKGTIKEVAEEEDKDKEDKEEEQRDTMSVGDSGVEEEDGVRRRRSARVKKTVNSK